MSYRDIDQWSDEQIRDHLLEIDQLDVSVSAFEADFINSVCFRNKEQTLSYAQINVAKQMIERYLV